MKSKFVLAILLVLAPTVYSCVNVGVTIVTQDGQPWSYTISAMLWDNSAQSDPPTCQYDGFPNAGPFKFQLSCSNGFTAYWTPPVAGDPDGGFVEYYPPGSGYTFETPVTNAGSWEYGACVFGCDSSSCFIAGATPS